MKIPNNEKRLNTKRLLRYKPRKGEESRQWKIQGIVNDRIILKQVKQKKNQQITFDSKLVLNYVEQKQYEIAWQQQCQKGIWPNTWQPQENIPDFTRLDYLLRKRSQLRISKKRSREMRIKSKESFNQHHLLSTRKMNIMSEKKIAFQEKRENIKKALDKKQYQNEQKLQKAQDYKDWFISYNFEPQEYEKLIHRNLKGTKNPDSQKMEIVDENQVVKILDEKYEFPYTFGNEKIQDQNLQKEEANTSLTKTQNQQQQKIRSIYHALSSGPSGMFIKDIHYLGDDNEVDYFILILFDGTQAYISEEDLVRYFPFVYEKFIMRKIDESIEDCRGSLMGVNHSLNFMHLSCIKNLGEKISFKKEDFDMTGQVQNIFNTKNTNTSFTDDYFVFGDRQVQIEAKKTPIQMEKKTEHSSPLSPKTIELNIQNYFYFLKEISHQDEIIQPQILDQVSDQYYSKPQSNILFKATRCKELFQKYEVGRMKEEMELQKRQKNQLQDNSSIHLTNNKIQISKRKLQIKKIEKPTQTQETIQIKLFEKIQKKSLLENSKIKTEEKQIFQILNVLEKAPKRQDDFYDSDDEEN